MVEVVITDEVIEGDLAELRERLIEFNVAATGYGDGRSLACYIRDDNGDLIAGLDGFTWGGYAKIEWLWISEQLRRQGLGRRIIEAVEAEAIRRGCGTIRVDTHAFQAPDFYRSLGYEEIGFHADTPVGFGEWMLAKRLR